jgi:hypothetical protein
MRFVRYVSLIDVVTAVMVLFILLLPPRTMTVAWAAKGAEPDRYSLAISEARSIDDRKDGELISELARRLGKAGFSDWAVEAGARGSVSAEGAPSQWRALLATSVAHVERLDAVPGLEYARKALAACAAARAVDERVCPSWEEVRMNLYARHLDAGVASGIDAHKDPEGFRRAGEAGLRTIHIGGAKSETSAPAPVSPKADGPKAPAAGSAAGSAAETAAPATPAR